MFLAVHCLGSFFMSRTRQWGATLSPPPSLNDSADFLLQDTHASCSHVLQQKDGWLPLWRCKGTLFYWISCCIVWYHVCCMPVSLLALALHCKFLKGRMMYSVPEALCRLLPFSGWRRYEDDDVIHVNVSMLREHRGTYCRIHDKFSVFLWLSCSLHVLEDFADQDTLQETKSTQR